MDNEQVITRIENLLKEKHMTMNSLKEYTNISTTVYQWRKNRNREATRTPSLKSIEKICEFFGISLSYFFAETKEEQLSVKQEELVDKIRKLGEEEFEAVSIMVNVLLQKEKR